MPTCVILRGIWAAFTAARRGGRISEADLDALLAGRGIFTRIFRPMFSIVTRSWHMYPIGFLFGLGFDTATEIGVLGISATQAAQGMSIWSIMVFPALFTAGMSLMDTADSMLMVRAYGWAFVNPLRKLWYNLTITAASVVVAIFIGGVEALGLIGGKLHLEARFWASVGALNENLTNFGFIVVGIFVASWIISSLVYRAKGYDRVRDRMSGTHADAVERVRSRRPTAVIGARLNAFNEAIVGYADRTPLHVIVRDPADGTIIGGISGRTSLGLLFIDLVFLPEDLRGTGIGTRMMAMAEAEARRRGCRSGVLYTISFQAPGLLPAARVARVRQVPCDPPGTSRVFLTKDFR